MSELVSSVTFRERDPSIPPLSSSSSGTDWEVGSAWGRFSSWTSLNCSCSSVSEEVGSSSEREILKSQEREKKLLTLSVTLPVAGQSSA